MPRRRAARPGMTLGEVMIVTVIIGILAAIAIPSYQKTIERGYRREAQDLMMTMYSGERSYYFAERRYHGPLDTTSTQLEWRTIFVDNPNLGSVPVTFDIQVDNSDADPANRTLMITATRTGSGPARSMTLNQLREWCGGSTDPSSCDGSWAP